MKKNISKDNAAQEDTAESGYLETAKENDENKFFHYLNSLPLNLRAETLIELPTPFKIDLILKYDTHALADILEVLESDDATDLFITISKTNKAKAEEIFLLLSDATQKNIEKLMLYSHQEAGSLMQTEIFKVSAKRTVAYAVEKLKKLKEHGIGTVQNVFITDDNGKFLKSISVDELILLNFDTKFEDVLDNYADNYSIVSHDSIDNVVSMIEKYNLVSIAVVDKMGHLLGRITHDDVLDVIQENATKQIYRLNNIDVTEEIQENISKTTKTRAKWLTINLVNATLASIVIGFFEHTLDTIVALAVLMPIVANMAGSASSQTVTIIVRQLALRQIDLRDMQSILKKELIVSAVNGLFLGFLTAIISQIRYHNILISISIALAMFFSFVTASIIATSVPMLFKKINIDPAVASSVFVLTSVDIISFFSFLWFAEMIIIPLSIK
ncbi:MAG: magnesium transporter [Campylobacterales bacterium]|nr:magnesium transporter [Campylobacterales bacterium]